MRASTIFAIIGAVLILVFFVGKYVIDDYMTSSLARSLERLNQKGFIFLKEDVQSIVNSVATKAAKTGYEIGQRHSKDTCMNSTVFFYDCSTKLGDSGLVVSFSPTEITLTE